MNDQLTPSASEAAESVHVDWRTRDETATRCVVDGIVALTGVPAAGLVPLYESIDPEALENLLHSASEGASPGGATAVSFRHQGCDVRITADGDLSVTLRDSDR